MSIVVCLSKKLQFVAIASAVTAVHRDCLLLVSNTGWSEIQAPISQGQITSADLPQWTDGQTKLILRETKAKSAEGFAPKVLHFCLVSWFQRNPWLDYLVFYCY